MKILLVWTHPNTDSLCSSIAKDMENEWLQKGHEIVTLDLYRTGFDPLLREIRSVGPKEYRCAEECPFPSDFLLYTHYQLLTWAEGLVFVYPIWWWDRPALLKGWFDNLFIWGHAIDLAETQPIGLLKNKRALVVQTCGSSEENLKEQKALSVIQGVMVDGTLEMCGVQVDRVHTFCAATTTDAKKYQTMLETLKEICSLWNEKGLESDPMGREALGADVC